MIHIHKLKADKQAAVVEARSALDANNTAKFDELSKQIEQIETRILQEERLAAFETAAPVSRDSLESELRHYSVSRALSGFVNGKLEGREAEVTQEMARGAAQTLGIRIPLSAIADYERRDITANAAVQDKSFQSLIPRLAPASKVIKAGATVLSGLGYGTISFPRMTGGPDANISWVAEGTGVTQGEATFDSVTLQPKSAGVFLKVSRRALVTNSIGLDALLRADLNASIGRAIDNAALLGGGANQPSGIMSAIPATSSAGQTDISLLASELMNKVELQNNGGNEDQVFFITQAVANYARKKRTGDGLPIPVNTQFYDVPVFPTNNVTGSTIIYGRASDLVIGFWNQAGTAPSVDITVDTSTYSSEGALKLVGLADVDVAFKQGSKSFAWATYTPAGS